MFKALKPLNCEAIQLACSAIKAREALGVDAVEEAIMQDDEDPTVQSHLNAVHQVWLFLIKAFSMLSTNAMLPQAAAAAYPLSSQDKKLISNMFIPVLKALHDENFNNQYNALISEIHSSLFTNHPYVNPNIRPSIPLAVQS
ncbi:hypothetical protein H1R20_g2958, partial [Candolleomyces eurysporus]